MFFQQRNHRRRSVKRRGAVAIQWIVMAALITVVIIASVQSLGRQSNERLESTSDSVGDPSSLVDKFD